MDTVNSNKELINVFEKKIIDTMINEGTVLIQLEYMDFSYCTNVIHIDEYQLKNDYFSLYDNSYELYFPLDNKAIINYDEEEDVFHFNHEDINIYISF